MSMDVTEASARCEAVLSAVERGVVADRSFLETLHTLRIQEPSTGDCGRFKPLDKPDVDHRACPNLLLLHVAPVNQRPELVVDGWTSTVELLSFFRDSIRAAL